MPHGSLLKVGIDMNSPSQSRTLLTFLALLATICALATACSSDEATSNGRGDSEEAATYSGDANSEFCQITRTIFETSTGETAEGLQTVVPVAIQNSQSWMEHAPQEISTAVDTFTQHIIAIDETLKNSDDPAADLASETSVLYAQVQDEEYIAAGAIIYDYGLEVCEVKFPEHVADDSTESVGSELDSVDD